MSEQGSTSPEIQGFEIVSTGLPKLDELLMGGLPLGTMIQIFGMKGVGKSLLAFQLAFQFITQTGRSVFYLDTEVGFDKSIMPFWYPIFCQRFKEIPLIQLRKECYAVKPRDRKLMEADVKAALESGLREFKVEYTEAQLNAAVWALLPEFKLIEPENAKPPAIFVLNEASLKDILGIHGVKVEILISDGGRVETRLLPGTQADVKATPIGQFCSKHDVGLIVYDSICSPLKSTFTSGTQDFPGRASAMNLWFGQSQKLCGYLNATILALNHETINPQAHYVSYYGGGPVGYDYKYSFQLRHWNRKPADLPQGCNCLNPEDEETAERAFISHRFPVRADRSAGVLLKLDAKGFT